MTAKRILLVDDDSALRQSLAAQFELHDEFSTAQEETGRRREKQVAYNKAHHITPTTVVKRADDVLWAVAEGDYLRVEKLHAAEDDWTADELDAEVTRLEAAMKAAATDLKFEKAAELRDRARYLKERSLLARCR